MTTWNSQPVSIPTFTWKMQDDGSTSFLAQETSILDLILQEDGGAIVLVYGTSWNIKPAN